MNVSLYRALTSVARLRQGPVARAVQKIHVNPDDVGDWLADYALAEARGRPSVWARAKILEAS